MILVPGFRDIDLGCDLGSPRTTGEGTENHISALLWREKACFYCTPGGIPIIQHPNKQPRNPALTSEAAPASPAVRPRRSESLERCGLPGEPER